MKKNKRTIQQLLIGVVVILLVTIIQYTNIQEVIETNKVQNVNSFDLANVPEYYGEPYVVINNNVPYFTAENYTKEGFEKYSLLDSLGRCRVAYANICKEIMPNTSDKRGSISSIYPTGWQNKEYQGVIDGGFLYNRCHLIGWQLAGENDNKLNLITGTRYMNVKGMLPFENLVDNYIEENEYNHVLYRVTPIYIANNLVASRRSNGSIFCRR